MFLGSNMLSMQIWRSSYKTISSWYIPNKEFSHTKILFRKKVTRVILDITSVPPKTNNNNNETNHKYKGYSVRYSLTIQATLIMNDKLPTYLVLKLPFQVYKANNENKIWQLLIYETWGSRSSEDVNVGLLGCNTVWTYADINISAICSPETLVSTYKSTWHCNPEDQHQLTHPWLPSSNTSLLLEN